jgi:hypothetical protein
MIHLEKHVHLKEILKEEKFLPLNPWLIPQQLRNDRNYKEEKENEVASNSF